MYSMTIQNAHVFSCGVMCLALHNAKRPYTPQLYVFSFVFHSNFLVPFDKYNLQLSTSDVNFPATDIEQIFKLFNSIKANVPMYTFQA